MTTNKRDHLHELEAELDALEKRLDREKRIQRNVRRLLVASLLVLLCVSALTFVVWMTSSPHALFPAG